MTLDDVQPGQVFKFRDVDTASKFQDREMVLASPLKDSREYRRVSYANKTNVVHGDMQRTRVVELVGDVADTFSFDMEIVRVDQENSTVVLYAPGDFDVAATTMLWQYEKPTPPTDKVGQRFLVTMTKLDD